MMASTAPENQTATLQPQTCQCSWVGLRFVINHGWQDSLMESLVRKPSRNITMLAKRVNMLASIHPSIPLSIYPMYSSMQPFIQWALNSFFVQSAEEMHQCCCHEGATDNFVFSVYCHLCCSAVLITQERVNPFPPKKCFT